ncbi:sulfurtransferase TusE, partial [Pantoea allii]
MNFNGNEIAVDAEGYLKSTDDWSEALAAHIAGLEGLTMTQAHWEV